MKIIRIWITLLIIQLFVVTGLWFMSRFEYVREEESVIENVPITNNEPIQNQQNPEPVIEDKKAPVVAQIQQASNILRIQDDDLKVESLQNRENQQLKITDGIVSVSKDSQNWIEVPVHPKDLQDFWLPYLRMGEQSYYMDEERILLAYTPSKQQPHLLVRNQANIWQDITFDVREGEIFGLYGLVGAGRTELLETIFGIRTRAAGRVYFNNKLMNFNSAKEAMDHGFALITEERKANGLFLKCDLTFNTTIANLPQYKSGIALSDSKMIKATANEIKIMHTKCMGPDDMISSLSGGNQQKVIFGKWLERSPQVFMMDEPTRGIDVGAKYEIYDLIIQMAKQGKTIIVVSSEMPEILGITNRIGVMSNGHLSGIVNTKETNQEELLRLSAKYL